MENEGFKEMFDEASKWMTESEFKEVEDAGEITVALQHEIFSQKHNLMFIRILQSLSKEQVKETVDTITELMQKLNGKEMGIIMVSLTYLVTETVRKFGEQIGEEIV